ncbi:MAG: glycosyltransferase [Gammaproteobacteria bacterium]|nr:glycosyltransferase [Gammaproteobacteria bacterium]MBD3821931.1 glycosyltransferase [Thiotrichales bacterium]
MKILIVANGVVRAGVSRVLSLLSQEWAKEHEVFVSLFRESEPSYPVGGTIIQQGIFLRGSIFSQVFFLYKLLKKNQFDRIYGFSEDANYPLAIASKLAGVNHKTILTVHNPIQKFSAKVTRRVKRVYPYAYKILGVSQGVVDGLAELVTESGKVVFRPNPIDLEMVDLRMSEAPQFQLPKKDGEIHFVGVGRLHKHKGFDLLIAAFSETVSSLPNARMWILGEGDEHQALQMQIDQLGLKDKVTLLGAVENPFAIIKQADIYVMSSRLEGWPLVLMEAMAVELPVISFTCPNGPDEIIQSQQQGILVECEDVRQLASEMMKLANDGSLRVILSHNARLRMQQFDVKNIAKQWLDV